MNNSSNLSNTMTYCHEAPEPSTTLICQEILYAIVCLVGLFGNTLVIYVVVRFSKMQTVTNMYILNLAIADECFLLGTPFQIVTMVKSSWIFGDLACKAYYILTGLNQFTRSIFLCIMSADQYIEVCHPISSTRLRTPFISGVVSFLAWTCSIIPMIPIIIYSKEVDFTCTDQDTEAEVSMKSCVIYWIPDTYFPYAFLLSYAMPLCMISVFYLLVINKLKTVGRQNISKEKKRSQRKVTNLVLTVVTVYIICWTPYWIMQLTLIFSWYAHETNDFVLKIHLLTSYLSYSNSAMNPILYAFLSEHFKKSFMKVCTCTASRDINAALHLENSVFPRKSNPNNETECDLGPLVSKGDPSTSAITMTSRTINTNSHNDNTKGQKLINNGLA